MGEIIDLSFASDPWINLQMLFAKIRGFDDNGAGGEVKKLPRILQVLLQRLRLKRTRDPAAAGFCSEELQELQVLQLDQ